MGGTAAPGHVDPPGDGDGVSCPAQAGLVPPQNGLAWGLREIGRIDRTLFTLDRLQSPELRGRVTVGLNKGEAKNALSRAVCFHRRGMVQDRTFDDQRLRAGGLNLVVAAIVLWNTVYLERAIGRRQSLPRHRLPRGEAFHAGTCFQTEV